jgi:hypothetical protein
MVPRVTDVKNHQFWTELPYISVFFHNTGITCDKNKSRKKNNNKDLKSYGTKDI